jgi:hypothetical protein
VIDAGGEDPVATQAVDVLSAEDVLQDRPGSGPLDGRELPGFGDRFPVGDEPAIVEGGVVLDGFLDEGLLLLQAQLVGGQ